MMQMLPPMAEGGKWLQTPDNRPPVYVVHEAHIKRMMLDEGAQMIADPRTPVEVKPVAAPLPSTNELALQAKVDQLEALVRQLLAQKTEESHATNEALETHTAKRK